MKTILVVEAETLERRILCDKLKSAGFAILEASDSETGFQIAVIQHPDLILLDIMLPKADGMKMAKLLRADDWGKYVPIIMLTEVSDMEKVQQAMELNIFEFFVKSDVRAEYIVENVKGLVRNNHKVGRISAIR